MITKKDIETVADHIGPLLSPTAHIIVAEALEQTNPRFNREKFLRRSIKAWEDKHLEPVNDYIRD